jgi:hypothetical protein
MNIGKKKTKKTKKQKGGLLQPLLSSPLATIFRFGPQKSFNTFIRERSNNILRRPNRENFIKEIKELLLSQEYQQNVPVFYGNQSDENKSRGYNEYICKIVGVFSSRKRIFIINPFAEFVYRFYIINYISKIIIEEDLNKKLDNLLKKLLKLDNFSGFPEIKYLRYGIRFCIVKDENSVEKVITSQQSNISRCKLLYGCSLMMSAEIREENLPLDQDIVELYDIIQKYNLWDYYKNLINKNNYFDGIIKLLLKLNNIKNIIKNIHAYNSNINRIQKMNNIKLKESRIENIHAYNSNINRIQKLKKLNELKESILKHQQNTRDSLVSTLITGLRDKILLLPISSIPQLEQLYNLVKSILEEQTNLKSLEVSIQQIIEYIKKLIDLNKLQSFMEFLETKPVEKSTILKILGISYQN